MANESVAQLPGGQLTGPEQELRDLLHRTAAKAAEVLPASGIVSLQEWVDSRIPRELALKVNKSGHIVLEKLEGPKPTSREDRSKLFLDALPEDHFMPEEEQLREAILSCLSGAPNKEFAKARLIIDTNVRDAMEAFLPRHVQLEQWIEWRIDAEVVCFERDGLQLMKLRTSLQENRELVVEAFFSSLPADEFTPQEEQMREAVVAFLETCPPERSHLSGLGMDPKVNEARKELLVQGDYSIKLGEWIERRIGEEFNLQLVDGTTWISMAGQAKGKGGANTKVNDKVTELTSEREKQLKSELEEREKEAFFVSLPADELTPEEVRMREAVIAFLETCPPGRSHLAGLGMDFQVNEARKELLERGPFKINLGDWIERRIGGEFDLQMADGMRWITLAGKDKGKGKGKTKDKDMGVGPVSEQEKELQLMEYERLKEIFFADLPADELTPEEVRMREAIIDFLETCPPGRSHLSGLGQDPKVNEARKELLVQGDFKITLSDWIERRVGGEFILQAAEGMRWITMPGKDKGKGKGKTKDKDKSMEPVSEHEKEPQVQAGEREKAGERAKEEFFASLPDDELTPEELRMREAVIAFLETCPPSRSHLSGLGMDPKVNEARKQLLEQGTVKIRLGDWIERRIGGEFNLKLVDGVKWLSLAGKDNGKGTDTGKEPISEHEKELKKEQRAKKEKDAEKQREDFFSRLPAEGFSPEEEDLRHQLFAFIDAYGTETCPTLTEAGQDEGIKKAKAVLLPPKCGVSMRLWMECRAEDDFEFFQQEGGRGKEVFFCLRGQASDEAVQRSIDYVNASQQKNKSRPNKTASAKDRRRKFFHMGNSHEMMSQEPPRKRAAYTPEPKVVRPPVRM